MNRSLPQRGFTLLELLLSIAIISVLGLLSTTFYARFMLQNAADNTSDQFAGSLRKAQMYSMMGKYNGSNTTWGVWYGSGVITMFLGSSYATRNTAYDERYTLNPGVSVSGFTEIIFAENTGLPTSGNPSNTPTITITAGGTTRTIIVNNQGVVNR